MHPHKNTHRAVYSDDMLTGAVTGSEDEKLHTETWFIVLMILIAVGVVGCLVLMAACVVRSVRQNKQSEGKYNGELPCMSSCGGLLIFFVFSSGRYKRWSYYNWCIKQGHCTGL